MEATTGRHRRALSWNCRRSGKISPATKEGRGDGGAWWDWGRRSRSRAASPSKDLSPGKEASPKRSRSPPKDKGGARTPDKDKGGARTPPKDRGGASISVKDDKSPTKSRPSSPLLSLSRPSSGPSSRPASPCCPLGPFIAALSPQSGASSPLGSSPSYRLDSVVLWASALFSPPSLIIDLDVSVGRGGATRLTGASGARGWAGAGREVHTGVT